MAQSCQTRMFCCWNPPTTAFGLLTPRYMFMIGLWPAHNCWINAPVFPSKIMCQYICTLIFAGCIGTSFKLQASCAHGHSRADTDPVTVNWTQGCSGAPYELKRMEDIYGIWPTKLGGCTWLNWEPSKSCSWDRLVETVRLLGLWWLFIYIWS